jgi:hypothetical protein
MRRRHATPLFDPYLLDTTLDPEARPQDDPAVLADLRSTLSHLNRQSFAQEFWDLAKQLEEYYAKLPERSRPTMRRALVRLLMVNDRWLQIVAAKTCAGLHLPEAVAPLRAILEIRRSEAFPMDDESRGAGESAEDQFMATIESSLAALESGARLSG